MIWGFGDPVAKGREKAARSARGALADYYAVPVPAPLTPASDLRLLAIDIETTGLDPTTDAVLSIGYVPIDGDVIVLGGARSMVLRDAGEVGQSATIHHLTDDVIAAGMDRAEALTATLAALAGRVLLAHHAPIEVQFLSKACIELFGAPFVTPVIDTMLLTNRIVAPGFDDEAKIDQLRLWNARERYGLPRYHAHEAATDALACAELYLAQVAELRGNQTLKTLTT